MKSKVRVLIPNAGKQWGKACGLWIRKDIAMDQVIISWRTQPVGCFYINFSWTQLNQMTNAKLTEGLLGFQLRAGCK